MAMRILVVEDEPLIASFIEKGLTAEGHAIEVAGDGPAAVGTFIHAPADLVILDVMLPGFDGFEVLSQIRQFDPLVPVIMLTARGDIEDRVRGLDLGATDYVVKPFAFAELAARVRSHLRTVDRLAAARRRAAQVQSARGTGRLSPVSVSDTVPRRGCGEMADAPGLGPGGGNPVEVQVLSPASEYPHHVIPYDGDPYRAQPSEKEAHGNRCRDPRGQQGQDSRRG